jgi:hypothetical protein
MSLTEENIEKLLVVYLNIDNGPNYDETAEIF